MLFYFTETHRSDASMEINERIDKEQRDLEKIVRKALAYAEKNGADEAVVSVSKSTGLSTSVRNRNVEKVTFRKTRSMAICVYKNKCKGVAASSDLSDSAVKDAIDAAIAISKHTEPDQYSGLPDKNDLLMESVDLDQFHPTEPNSDECIETALELEKIGLSNPKIKQSMGARISQNYGLAVRGNTLGQIFSHKHSGFSRSLSLTAEQDGISECGSGWHSSCDKNDLWDLEKIAKEAIEDTVSQLGARKIKTTSAPVIFDRLEAATIFEWLEDGLYGSNQFHKSSFINECLGQKLFPRWLNITEDPLIKKSAYSSPIDADGVKTFKHPIITDGAVASYILSTYSARQLKLPCTGNSGGTYTWFITNNGISRQRLIKQMGTGLVITSLMGSGFDSVTGDISYGARGLWYENGELVCPVKEVTIAGNARDIFSSIVAISNDIDERSSCKTGSVLLGEMKIAGA